MHLKMSIQIIVCTLLFISTLRANAGTLTLDTIQNYKNWKALVIKNEYITVATVPEMGGNILQYDFGIDTFLLLEPKTFGKSFSDGLGISPFENSWGFGGFETWPMPEGWPPPQTYRVFSFITETGNADSIVIIKKYY